MTILIVDDDADDLQFFADAVTEIDATIQCITAYNGIEALQVLETTRPLPDFIFLDLNMPRMGGRQCLRHIKNNPMLRSIPVIIYSTSRRPEDIHDALEAGATDFITKPTKFHLLRTEIAKVIQKQD